MSCFSQVFWRYVLNADLNIQKQALVKCKLGQTLKAVSSENAANRQIMGAKATDDNRLCIFNCAFSFKC